MGIYAPWTTRGNQCGGQPVLLGNCLVRTDHTDLEDNQARKTSAKGAFSNHLGACSIGNVRSNLIPFHLRANVLAQPVDDARPSSHPTRIIPTPVAHSSSPVDQEPVLYDHICILCDAITHHLCCLLVLGSARSRHTSLRPFLMENPPLPPCPIVNRLGRYLDDRFFPCLGTSFSERRRDQTGQDQPSRHLCVHAGIFCRHNRPLVPRIEVSVLS